MSTGNAYNDILTVVRRLVDRLRAASVWPDLIEDITALNVALHEAGMETHTTVAQVKQLFPNPPPRERLQALFDTLEAMLQDSDHPLCQDKDLNEQIVSSLRRADLPTVLNSGPAIQTLLAVFSEYAVADSDLWFFSHLLAFWYMTKREVLSGGPIEPGNLVEHLDGFIEDVPAPDNDFKFGDPLPFRKEDIVDG